MGKNNLKETALFLKIIENFMERYVNEEDEALCYLN